jgi:hypothetical protein
MSILTTIALTIGGALVKQMVAGELGEGLGSTLVEELLDLVRDRVKDVALSAFSVFSLQFPSFLAHQRDLQRSKGKNNAKNFSRMSGPKCAKRFASS